MGDKGNVYHCSWKRTDDGDFVGWLIKRPKLRAQADSLHSLMRKLGNVVGEYHNDFEAALDFDPPFETVSEHHALFKDDWVSMNWNCGFQSEGDAKDDFTDGKCIRCGRASGTRTNSELRVDHPLKGTDGAFGGRFETFLMIVTEGFLSLLKPCELELFEARPVNTGDCLASYPAAVSRIGA